jgi:hypothetical protein
MHLKDPLGSFKKSSGIFIPETQDLFVWPLGNFLAPVLIKIKYKTFVIHVLLDESTPS